jgi:hypothetical protein
MNVASPDLTEWNGKSILYSLDTGMGRKSGKGQLLVIPNDEKTIFFIQTKKLTLDEDMAVETIPIPEAAIPHIQKSFSISTDLVCFA